MSDGDRERIKERTRFKATRAHQGRNHWHVDIRSSVIVCRACGAKIPKYLEPQFCPECGDGKEPDAKHRPRVSR